MPRQHRKHRSRRKRQGGVCREHQEEQRYLSGRRIPGIERPRWGGQTSFSSGLRCRPPRTELDMAEREFQAYKNRCLEENPVRGEKVAQAVMESR